MQDEGAPRSRLDAIMGAIEDLLDQGHEDTTIASLAKRRDDVARTASFLVETYGMNAVDRAKFLESRKQDSGFARAVRMAVEKLTAGDGSSS